MKRSVSSGMNAGTPEGFAKCATMHGGVVNTTVMIGHLTQDHDTPTQEIKGITDFNHFVFEEKGIRYKKHSTIGEGKLQKLEEPVEMPEKFHYDIWGEEEGQVKRRTYKPFKAPGTLETIKEGDENETDGVPEEDEENDLGVTFECPNELCDKSFKTNIEREEHCLSKQCTLTVMEATSKLWTSQFSVKMFKNLSPQERQSMPFFLTALEIIRILDSIERLLLDFEPEFCEGFALRRKKPKSKFNQNQETFVLNQFKKGEFDKSKKVPAEEVVKRMRRVTVPDPKHPGQEICMFKKSEWLTEAQVKGLYGKFDRLRTEKGKKALLDTEEVLSANYDHHAYHEDIAILAEKANEVLPLAEQDHPFEVAFYLHYKIKIPSASTFFHFLFQVGDIPLCEIVREHEETKLSLRGDTQLSNLTFKELQEVVRAVNKGRGTRSFADGQKLLINYVRKNCVCLDHIRK